MLGEMLGVKGIIMRSILGIINILLSVLEIGIVQFTQFTQFTCYVKPIFKKQVVVKIKPGSYSWKLLIIRNYLIFLWKKVILHGKLKFFIRLLHKIKIWKLWWFLHWSRRGRGTRRRWWSISIQISVRCRKGTHSAVVLHWNVGFEFGPLFRSKPIVGIDMVMQDLSLQG